MTTKAIKVLFWLQSSPYDGMSFREGLDAALAFAAFDQDVTLFFDSKALPALFDNQEPASVGQKDISKNIKALPMYDINQIFLHEESLSLFKSQGVALIINGNPINPLRLKLESFDQTFIY